MKNGFVALLVMGALALCSLAFAAPQPLTNEDLSQVVAGEASATLDNAVAVDGVASSNTAAGALATDLGTAVNGDANTLTYDPSDSAIAYLDSQAINAGYNTYGTALAVDNSQASYSYDPSASAVNLGDDNVATNFYANGDVANATDNGIAVGYADDAATAMGTDNQAFEANDDVAVASNGVAVGYAEDSAQNIGFGNLAIEDAGDVTFATEDGVTIQEPDNVALAQDCGTAITNDGQLAITATGIAFADPDNTALAYGEGSVAIYDSLDVALASDDAKAVNTYDALLVDNHSAAFESNGDVANTTGPAPAIASDGEVALATDGSIAIATPDDTNIALNGNAAQSTSDGQAVAGDCNAVIFQEAFNIYEIPGSQSIYEEDNGDAVAAMDNAQVNLTNNSLECSTVEYGSAAVIGNGNHVSAVDDDADITVNTLASGSFTTTQDGEDFNPPAIFGVVAKNAEVTCSFNLDFEETEVTATITDSFNVETNAVSISGQEEASGIALVSSLGDPQSGLNMNVTSASATIPVSTTATAPALTTGISTATTTLTQSILNDTSTITITF